MSGRASAVLPAQAGPRLKLERSKPSAAHLSRRVQRPRRPNVRLSPLGHGLRDRPPGGEKAETTKKCRNRQHHQPNLVIAIMVRK